MVATLLRPTGVVVDGLDLNNIEPSGLVWEFKTIDGWTNGPGVNVDQTQRVVSHGQFFQRGHRTGKLLTIVGWIKGPRALIAEGIDRLNACLADGEQGLFQFTDVNLGLRWTYVQLFGAPIIPWNGSPTVKYQLQLLANDSYKYGATSTASTPFGSSPAGGGLVYPLHGGPALDYGAQGTTGGVTITNAGSADASVKFTVTGPTPAGGFIIVDQATGKSITYLGAVVPAGSSIVLDSSDGSVLIDGYADRLGETVVEAWPVVPAKSSKDFTFIPLGASTASVLTAECIATYW